MKKRKKASRFRGSHTHGRGGKKKARGSGHRGGFGKAGTGKRADQKKTLILNLDKKYFGKSKTWRKKIPKKTKIINLNQISNLYRGKKEINFGGYKILGTGNIEEKIIIKAASVSKSALDKVKKVGGDIILEN